MIHQLYLVTASTHLEDEHLTSEDRHRVEVSVANVGLAVSRQRGSGVAGVGVVFALRVGGRPA